MTLGLAYLIGAYLIGSVCTGWLLVRVFAGADLRHLGSENVGARNAGRILGPFGFIGTLFGDCLKGGVIVVAGFALGLDAWWIAGGMVLVVVGHTWPIFLNFHGGKGLGTFLGALFWFDLRLMTFFFAAWALSWVIMRHAGLACLVAVGLVPLLALLMALTIGELPVAADGAGLDGLFAQQGLLSQLIPFRLNAFRTSGLAFAVGLLGQSAIVLLAHASNIKEYAGQMTARRALSSEMANA